MEQKYLDMNLGQRKDSFQEYVLHVEVDVTIFLGQEFIVPPTAC